MSEKGKTLEKGKGTLEAVRKRLQPMVVKSLAEGGAIRKPRELFENMRSKKYEYEPLPSPSHIRLIKVEAAAALDPVHCSIKIVDLNDKPAFLALSYSWKQDMSLASLVSTSCKFGRQYSEWGLIQNKNTREGHRDPVSSDERSIKSKEITQALLKEPSCKETWKSPTIFCDGKSKTIEPNLYNALLHLRKHKPGYFWIDAVCINQIDLVEQSAQVQIMGRIYRSAAGVVVWLGDVPAVLDAGMQKLSEKLARPSATAPSGFGANDLKGFDGAILQMAMAWLLTRRWFRWLWVVQESCLARQMTFILGDYDFSPGSFSHVMRWLDELLPEEALGVVTLLLSAWATQIKRIPAMLASNEFFQSGGRWTLRDWLDATTARKARYSIDVVFAGLALVDVQSLVIDQGLQLPEKQSGLQPPHQRLWQLLHADYKAEPPFVLLNLAACILSHWDFNVLFAISLRYRPPPTTAISKTLLLPQASWIPDPSRWSLRELQPGFMVSNSKRPLSLPKSSEDPGPRISADGTTLFMTAVKLDEITQYFSLSGFVTTDTGPKMIDLADWVAQFIPRVYLATGGSGLRTFVKVAMSKYLMKQQPVAELIEMGMYWLFCASIDSWLQDKISLQKKKKAEERRMGEQAEDLKKKQEEEKQKERKRKEQDEDDLYFFPAWLPFVGANVPVLSNAKHSETAYTAYTELKKSHPDALWLESLEKLKASKDSQSSGEQQPELSQELVEIDKEISRLKNDADKTTANAMEDFKERAKREVTRHYAEDLQMQSIFVTKQGYIGIGPNGLQVGDSVFLIADGKAPYIFTHIDDVLRRRAAQIRKEIDGRVDAASESDLREKLLKVEAKIGKQDGYQLVGEAYIEGVMNGEVADQLKDRTKRYSFL